MFKSALNTTEALLICLFICHREAHYTQTFELFVKVIQAKLC